MTTRQEQDAERVGSGEGPVYVSWSQLSTYAQCGWKYKSNYRDHVPQEPQGPFLGGRAIHDAIEWAEPQGYWREDGMVEWVMADARRRFEEMVEEDGGPANIRWGGRKDRDGNPGEDYRWWHFNLGLMSKNWAATRRLDQINGMQMVEGSTEFALSVTLPSGTLLKVRIDAAMLETADGALVVRDWKAGRIGGAEVKQLGIYGWALHEGPGWDVTLGEFGYLRRAGELQRHNIGHLVEFVPAWFEKYAAGIEHGIFPVEPNVFCSSCPVRHYCPHGKTLL
jgi:putative RecB family exonuclease